MSDHRNCPECGAPLPQESAFGPCPACVLRGALALSSGTAEAATLEQPGQFIGPYKLIQRLGEGGCGVVYRAEQTQPLHRFVALKVIKLGMDTRQVIARFEAERQALALMDHPGIAKVFEAGSSATGRPYFVMELVEGRKITDYCNESNLSTRQRLGLFVQVCRAIQHDHQKGVIHRDLKPSNILVAVQDGTPVPKVIDFGIAKATGQQLTENTIFTAMGEFIGTPAYMSPEQAGLAGLDVDTRSDIYALGVLLYELLTGHTPFERADLLQSGLDEMRRVIRDLEPLKPSTKLGTLTPADLTAVARRHRTEPPRLLNMVRGDLDWIAMKCLEKDRARRYEAAHGLALDIERHLNNEPVTAAAPGHWYRLQKFVRRHRIGLAMSGTVVLLLMAGIVASTWQAVRATKAEREQTRLRRQAQAAEAASRIEAAKSRQVAKFLTDMLEGVEPSVAQGLDTKMMRQILDKTAERLGRELTNQPQVEAELRNTVGNVYSELGDYAKAEDLIRHALDLRRKLFVNENSGVALSLNDLAVVLFKEGKLAEAEAADRQALALREKLFGDENADTAESMHNLGGALVPQGKFAEAETLFRKVVAVRKKLLAADDPLLATTLGNLGTALWYQNKFAEAEKAYRETLAIQRKTLSDLHPDVATSLHNLACLLQSQGKLTEAESFGEQALEIRRQLLGTDHTDYASTLAALATIYQGQGRFAEAEAAQRDALAIQRQRLGPENYETAVSLNNLGDILRVEGKWTEAETVQRQAVGLLKKALGDESSIAATGMDVLGNILRDEGKLDEAETCQRTTLALRQKTLPDDNPDLAQSLNDLASVLVAEGGAGPRASVSLISSSNLPPPPTNAPRLQEAETLLRQALTMRRKLLGHEHPDTLDSLNTLASVLQQRDSLAEAESLAREGQSQCDKLLPDDWRSFDTRSLLGGILLTRTNYTEAEPLLLSGFDGMKQHFDKIPAGNRHRLQETAARLVQLYTATAQPARAAQWKKAASEKF